MIIRVFEIYFYKPLVNIAATDYDDVCISILLKAVKHGHSIIITPS